MPGNRADEDGLSRIIAEHAAQGTHRLAQGAVGYDDVAPDGSENLPAMNRLVAALDQQNEEVEVARNQRGFLPFSSRSRRDGDKTKLPKPNRGFV